MMDVDACSGGHVDRMGVILSVLHVYGATMAETCEPDCARRSIQWIDADPERMLQAAKRSNPDMAHIETAEPRPRFSQEEDGEMHTIVQRLMPDAGVNPEGGFRISKRSLVSLMCKLDDAGLDTTDQATLGMLYNILRFNNGFAQEGYELPDDGGKVEDLIRALIERLSGEDCICPGKLMAIMGVSRLSKFEIREKLLLRLYLEADVVRGEELEKGCGFPSLRERALCPFTTFE